MAQMLGKRLFDAAVCVLAQQPNFQLEFSRLLRETCPVNVSLNSSRCTDCDATSPSMLSYSRPHTPTSAQARSRHSPAYISEKRLRRAELEVETCRGHADSLQQELGKLQAKLSKEQAYEKRQKSKIEALKLQVVHVRNTGQLVLRQRQQQEAAIQRARDEASALEAQIDNLKSVIHSLSQAYEGFEVQVRGKDPAELLHKLFSGLNDVCDSKILEASQNAAINVTRDRFMTSSEVDALLMQQKHLMRRLDELQADLQRENMRVFDSCLAFSKK